MIDQKKSIKISVQTHYVSDMLNSLKTWMKRLRRPVGRRPEDDGYEAWCRDPLSHPQLRNLSERQLADLPFDPKAICRR